MHFPVLPFSRLAQTVKKPPITGYPWHPQTLGEQILKRRLDLGLSQIEVAQMLNLGLQTISRWELNKNTPNNCHYAGIIKLLGYCPEVKSSSILNTLSIKKFAKLIKD